MFFNNNVIFCLTEECAYCKKSFDAEKISFHEKRCRVKCPECSDFVLYQNWQEHQCQISGAEGTLLNSVRLVKYSEYIFILYVCRVTNSTEINFLI